ncbi:hypothetical protein G6F57_021129 [Rhizopus arrhizus]|nr:hypothetical protein G6F57_021129 [Rhizopus arrhizus]
MVEQVQGVRAEIDEQAAAGDRGVGPPEVRRCGMRRVWPVQGRAHAARRTDRAAVQQLLDLREAGQGASVISNEHRYATACAGLQNAHALAMVHGHGLFDIDRLARRNGLQRVLHVGGGRRGDVDRVHLRIGDERIGIGIPAGNRMAPCVILGQCRIAPHHGSHP